MFEINTINHNIQLDFDTSEVKRTVIKQGSQNTHVLFIQLYDHNSQLTISPDWDISLSALKGDNTYILNSDNISVEDNTIQITLTKQMLTAPGTEKCELIIRYNGDTLFSNTFLLYVEPNVQDGSAITSTNEFNTITDILDYVSDRKTMINHILEDLETTLGEYSTVVDNIEGLEEKISVMNTALNSKASDESPTLTGTPKAPTAAAGTNTTQIATTAFVQTAVGNGIAASDAMIIKGTIGTSGTVTTLPTTYKTGWTYRVVTNGTYAGQVCEIGDLIIALADRSGSGNLDTDWCVAQTNINGAITSIKSGDAYITVDQSGSTVTISHTSVSRTNTTSDASPSAGSTFTTVDSITSDSKGHVTKVNTKTITLPSTSVAVDSALSSTSTNPVQNKVVKTSLDNKLSLTGGTVTGTIYFNGSAAKYPGYISHDASSLTIQAPSANTTSITSTPIGCGLQFKACYSGILPLFPKAEVGVSLNCLGSATYPFGTIYSVASTLNSDRKLKKDIVPLDQEQDVFDSIFDHINFVKFRWRENYNGALETKPSSRYHYGIIAQEVEELMHHYGLTNYDNGFIHSNFFLDNTTECYITGGYSTAKEGYDYSQNVWNYKHDKEYEICNEVIEKNFSELDRGDRYKHRSQIQYILIQDISKVAAEGKQPPITINSITFVDKKGNKIPVPLRLEGGISCYDPEDTNFENPGSSATANEDGSITISFNDMWSSYMIQIADDDHCFDFYDYESIIADIDFIGEYKIYLIPKGTYQTCDFWNDRDRTDEVVYDYSFNYQELTNMSLAVLQHTRKNFLSYKEESERRVSELENKLSELEKTIQNMSGEEDT